MADKVEVYLERYSDGVRYKEFTAPPGNPRYTGDPNEKYIEATTDERFRIVVKLLRGFNFMGSPKVRVEYFVDQGNSLWESLSKSKSQSATPSYRSHRECSLEEIEQFINGQYMICGLTFGELKTDDDMILDDHSIAEEADRQGRIVVKLRRGHFAHRKVADYGGEKSFDPPEHVDTETTHAQVVHKHHVSHVLKHVPLRPSNMAFEAPRGYERQWVRATGEASKPIVFTLRYRSRKALLALGIIDENTPVTSSSKEGDRTMSHRPRAQGKAKKDVRGRPTVLTDAKKTISSSARSPSKGLTPGPLLSSMMHADDDEDEDDDDDDDDEELRVKTSPTSFATTEQHFNLSARPTMSPTPFQALSTPGPNPSTGLTPAPSAPPEVYSLFTDDEEDGQDSNNNANEHTTFPLSSADDVRKELTLGIQGSKSDNVSNGRASSRDDNNDNSDYGDNGEGASSPEGEMVGPGYATPPRYGVSSSHPIALGLSDEERKRAWSKVLQTEQEIEEEEAAAILASEKRERRRRELMDAKRSFLNLER